MGKLVRSVTPPEEGKGEAKEVEVVTAKSSDKEIALALNDADNRFIYVLENRTNMLTSMYPSMKVQRGFDLVLHEDERCAFYLACRLHRLTVLRVANQNC